MPGNNPGANSRFGGGSTVYATQAAIRAGYSAKTAEQVGHQLLKKTSVQAAIAERMKAREKRTDGKVMARVRGGFGKGRSGVL